MDRVCDIAFTLTISLTLSHSNWFWMSLCSQVDTADKLPARIGLTKQRQKQRLQILSVITTTACLQRRQRQQQQRQSLARVLFQKIVDACQSLQSFIWELLFWCFQMLFGWSPDGSGVDVAAAVSCYVT